MTPQQANLAADIIQRHLPSDPYSMSDALAVVAELRALSAQPCVWRFENGTLLASNPGRPALVLPRVSAFAAVAGSSIAKPGKWIDATFLLLESASSTASRHTLKAQRYGLAKRLKDRHLNTLSEAVRSIHLKTVGASVRAVYDPDGMPIRIE